MEPTDPDARGKKMRLFVERVLRWQFGEAMLNDPAFDQLIEEVHGALAGNEQAVEILKALEAGSRHAGKG